ncbi:MAG: DUF885 family protein [Acidobacteria bacterium]|nr:DUF885 family protein [Acidobacteriota bacterium]
MSRTFEIADAYVDEAAALDPILATAAGLPGHDHEMTDYSPDGFAARAALDRRTLDELAAVSVDGERDRIARDVMLDGLSSEMELFDAGDHFHSLRTLANPISRVRSIFDQMGRESVEDWLGRARDSLLTFLRDEDSCGEIFGSFWFSLSIFISESFKQKEEV